MKQLIGDISQSYQESLSIATYPKYIVFVFNGIIHLVVPKIKAHQDFYHFSLILFYTYNHFVLQ